MTTPLDRRFAADAEAHRTGRAAVLPGVLGGAGIATEFWEADDRRFYCSCTGCGWTGEITPTGAVAWATSRTWARTGQPTAPLSWGGRARASATISCARSRTPRSSREVEPVVGVDAGEPVLRVLQPDGLGVEDRAEALGEPTVDDQPLGVAQHEAGVGGELGGIGADLAELGEASGHGVVRLLGPTQL